MDRYQNTKLNNMSKQMEREIEMERYQYDSISMG